MFSDILQVSQYSNNLIVKKIFLIILNSLKTE